MEREQQLVRRPVGAVDDEAPAELVGQRADFGAVACEPLLVVGPPVLGAAGNDFAEYLFIHEFGHHFSGLADEYYTSPVAYEPPARIFEPWAANVTAATDRARLKWADLLTPAVPVPTPWPKQPFEALQKDYQSTRAKLRADKRPEVEMTRLFKTEAEAEMKLFPTAEHRGKVGLFQGANYDAQAFYRPEIDCIMFSRNPVPFCKVCQRALSSQIDRHTARR